MQNELSANKRVKLELGLLKSCQGKLGANDVKMKEL